MNRIQLACFCLLASAFVLAGLLVTQLYRQGPVIPEAHAGQIANYRSVTLMTAQTSNNEEALFALDSMNERLLVYRVDLGKKRLEMATAVDLPQLFRVSPRPTRGPRRGR